MKRIVMIQGGGRPKGNTAQLVDSFKRGAEEAGHNVEVISLLRHEVKGCLGCNACRYGKPCVQKDSFNGLVPKSGRRICWSSRPRCISGHCPPRSRRSLSGSTVSRRRTPTHPWAGMKSIR